MVARRGKVPRSCGGVKPRAMRWPILVQAGKRPVPGAFCVRCEDA